MRLYIIRHGETPWNKLKKFQGQTDIELNEKGIELAKITGQGMKDIDFDLCFCSPLTRARQTASLILGDRNTQIIIDERIKEIGFGDWEGCLATADGPIDPEYLKHFYVNPLKCMRPPHGESFQDLLVRTKDFYTDLISNEAYSDKTILISSHGAASRCLLQAIDETGDVWRGCIPPNCAVTIVDVIDGQGKIIEQDKIYY